MVGHAVRWRETGSDGAVFQSLKCKNPENLLLFGDVGRLSGLTKNCIEAVALCREYSFMLREFQDFSCRLLLCNISAGWCG
ncbi:RepA leader peptide Tap [Yersinia ruckeri]|uniref:RepA leader peptide Tap n=1 Tax=Yersinia ruckeri TaxID=29486 RepID=UPI003BF4945E